ncbi:aldo-keto reductase [Aspergillus sclerotioniger CBS 115572]|uniref:D-xylose reductase [NAD(P)H] n=1 Tax=Aspergillus sclerotioniger CBS 115572 TaxID=1450535 RepID=A0A317X1H4_9EURO|nr:aldo-keto reductase [Aspergillus sclerotioniger CBS 115572]PWY91397.1 aldo-keto reductase [Aspergillus sclerotioniger CBS 115572]
MSANYTLTDLLPLPNSPIKVPRLGFGVYRSPSTQTVQSCLKALEIGYRHIDTAQFYANEKEVGDAIRSSGLPRSEIFVTTKILSPAGSPEATYERLVASVDKIGGKDGYVDLFLIHSSKSGSPGRKELWQALERLLEEGRTKSIGVSNFGVKHIEEMKAYAKVWPPHVNQIELHPWCQQRVVDAYCKKNKIIVESYSPIVRNYKANDPTLVDLAEKYNKTTQQVLIRYALQKEWVPLPKTDNADRIAANANVFDFDISEEDMAVLNALDQGSSGAIVEAVENE